jgi:hypothetical protein
VMLAIRSLFVSHLLALHQLDALETRLLTG